MHYYLKIIFILYLTFCLNTDVYPAENEVSTLERRLTDMEYFTRLLEFTAGLLVILCLALLVLLIIFVKRNRIKTRQIRQYAQNQVMAPEKDTATATDDNLMNVTEKRAPDPVLRKDFSAKKVEDLMKEIGTLQQELTKEQLLRKQMEEEVAELLSRLKRT